MKDIPLFSTKEGRLILVGGGLVFVVLVVLVVLVATGVIKIGGNDGSGGSQGGVEVIVDPVSGETIHKTQAESQMTDETIMMIGFHQLQKMGLLAKQYSKVINTISQYIDKNYPDYNQISYEKDSYKYTNDTWTKSTFRFASDTGQYFRVNLDTKNSISDIEVTIVKE